jgi:uncharacterized protein (DUF1330 family)
MSNAYAVGQITVKNPEQWVEYRDQVPATLAPYGGEVVFRGNQLAALAGQNPYPDIVVIRFPTMTALNNWFSSPAYQALIPLRDGAADVVLTSYQA